jgi:hypothetical protein
MGLEFRDLSFLSDAKASTLRAGDKNGAKAGLPEPSIERRFDRPAGRVWDLRSGR